MEKQTKNLAKIQAPTVKKSESVVKMIDITPPVKNLESTIQVVMSLGRMIKQVTNLKTQNSQLEEFEVTAEGDYNTHELRIQDSRRRDFTTKDPQLIKDVIQFIRTRINETVIDIEAQIVLPR